AGKVSAPASLSRLRQMTIVRTNSSAATRLLLEYLTAVTDIAVEPVGAHEVRVSLLGSYREDAMRLALYLRLRAWEAGQRADGVDVKLDLDATEPPTAANA
ncbi:MAG: hypothetical protein ACHP7F_12880, partial [Actinomycetales bacterium]